MVPLHARLPVDHVVALRAVLLFVVSEFSSLSARVPTRLRGRPSRRQRECEEVRRVDFSGGSFLQPSGDQRHGRR
jgi:hypothetical protein